jgi:hypothetical protein
MSKSILCCLSFLYLELCCSNWCEIFMVCSFWYVCVVVKFYEHWMLDEWDIGLACSLVLFYLSNLSFSYRLLYVSKWLEIGTVDYCDDMLAIIIFVEFMVYFWYMFIKPPYYPNKLRIVLKEFIWWWTLCFWVFISHVWHVGKVSFVQLYVCNIS